MDLGFQFFVYISGSCDPGTNTPGGNRCAAHGIDFPAVGGHLERTGNGSAFKLRHKCRVTLGSSAQSGGFTVGGDADAEDFVVVDIDP